MVDNFAESLIAPKNLVFTNPTHVVALSKAPLAEFIILFIEENLTNSQRYVISARSTGQ